MTDKFEQGKPFLDLHLGAEGARLAMENSPELTRHVVEHGYADFYTNDTLDQRARKIATLASLITSASLPQFEWHTRGALESKLLTADEIREIIVQMTIYIGYPAAYNALAVAKRVFAEFEPGCDSPFGS
jgi:4-carboxymuconolactone decarboxylase